MSLCGCARTGGSGRGRGSWPWSFLGRWITPLLLARRDERPTAPARGPGQQIAGASGATLHVERHGPAGGPPILFTHGWGLDSSFWSYARQDLADRFSLTFWDLPGLGGSRARTISLEAFAADLATLLEAAGRRPVVLVGHSIGGMTIQTLIRDRPDLADRIAGVILLDTTHTNPLRTMIFSRLLLALQKPVIEPAERLTQRLHPLVWLSKWQSYLSGTAHLVNRFGFGPARPTRSQLEHITRLTTQAPPVVEAAGNLAMLRWDATGALARFRRPVLVIAGDADIVTKLEANREIARTAPAGRLQVVHGANHLGPMEAAAAYNRLIADFALAVQPAVSADLPQTAGRAAEVDRLGDRRTWEGGPATPPL